MVHDAEPLGLETGQADRMTGARPDPVHPALKQVRAAGDRTESRCDVAGVGSPAIPGSGGGNPDRTIASPPLTMSARENGTHRQLIQQAGCDFGAGHETPSSTTRSTTRRQASLWSGCR